MNFKGIFLGDEKTFTSKVALFHFIILSASILFLYLFSYSTSPRYFFIGVDSIIFQTVGKCWAEGVLPYVGTFENKGPLLFLINALGYMIYPRYGIMLLQIPFMYFSFLFMWRTVELYWSRRATLIIFLFMIFWRALFFTEGNRTEEYSMTFLMAATYFFLRYLKEEKIFLEPFVGFIYGLGFGACVLLRTTNGLPICCYVLLTTIFLIHAGAFKNIWQNFLSFCAGFVIICLPFVIYFAAHGALYDMLYGTILLNIKHVTGYYSTHAEGYHEYMIAYAITKFTPLYWLILAALLDIFSNPKSKLAWSGLFTGAAMLFMLIKSRPFEGYLELIVSLLPVLFAVLYSLKINFLPRLKEIWEIRGISLKRIFCKTLILIMIPIFALNLYLTLRNSYLLVFFEFNNSERLTKYSQRKQNEIYELQSLIPTDERNSVVCWGDCVSISHFLFESRLTPRCRFFQNINCFFGKSDPAVIDEWIENVRSDYPKWIVYSTLPKEYSGEEIDYFNSEFRRQRNPRVEEILNEKYTLAKEMKLYQDTIKLYRLKE